MDMTFKLQVFEGPVSYTHLDVYKRQVGCSIMRGRKPLWTSG